MYYTVFTVVLVAVVVVVVYVFELSAALEFYNDRALNATDPMRAND